MNEGNRGRFGDSTATVSPSPVSPALVRWRAVAALLALTLLAGCGDLNTDYGRASGRTGRVSLNGFGAFRSTFDRAGVRTRDLNRLGDRAVRHDVIVWTPQVLDSIDPTVGDWFERWLKRGDRTLIYVVPDSGSEAEYWIEAGRFAPPEQKLEYRRRAARGVNERLRWRLNREGTVAEGWFQVEPMTERVPMRSPRGRWGEVFERDPEQKDDGVRSVAGVEVRLTPIPDPASPGGKSSTRVGGPGSQTGATGPSSMSWMAPPRRWVSKTETATERLLESERGDAVVVRISSDEWNGSKVIVVGGGSLLTNFALAQTDHRELARRLVAEAVGASRGSGGDVSAGEETAGEGTDDSGSKGEDEVVGTEEVAGDGEATGDGGDRSRSLSAGFLTSDWQGVRVSESKPGVPKASGMELLTVWPLSLVTTHAVMLGVVVCLMLIPVFGRPAKVRHRRTNRFGDHLDAIAALMNKAGGESFARERIAAYMRQVRGETGGPWVRPIAEAAPASAEATPVPDPPRPNGDPFATGPTTSRPQPHDEAAR